MVEFSRIEILAKELGYSVSRQGDLYLNGKMIDYKSNDGGYRYFSIRRNGKSVHCYYHRLQAYQKFGDAIYKKGICVRHLNNDCTDNTFDNIQIGTYQDNQNDRPREKILAIIRKMQIANGGGGHGTKIGDDIKVKIREDRRAGMPYYRIAEKYGKSYAGVYYVCNHSLS